jgi:hypothetical protein
MQVLNSNTTNNIPYNIMELKNDELLSTLQAWTRLDLIEWLVWNDSNGVYKDEDSIEEFGNVVSKEEAIEIITRQILEGRGD